MNLASSPVLQRKAERTGEGTERCPFPSELPCRLKPRRSQPVNHRDYFVTTWEKLTDLLPTKFKSP
jgi:hypothetical protein